MRSASDEFRGRQYAVRGVEIWRSGSVQSPGEVIGPDAQGVEVPALAVVSCLVFDALSAWHLGEIASRQAKMAEAVSVAKESNDGHSLAMALFFAAVLAHFEGNAAEVERLASEAVELSTRQNFAQLLYAGTAARNWTRSASGHTAEGVSRIEDAIRDYRATGAMLGLPYFLGIKAEALHFADRTSEAPDCFLTVAERSDPRNTTPCNPEDPLPNAIK